VRAAARAGGVALGMNGAAGRAVDEPLSTWVDEWFAAYDAGADATTYAGLGVR